MSKHLLTVMLSELVTIRLLCQRPGCTGVAEFSVKQFGERDAHSCPACGGHLIFDQSLPHKALVAAIDRLAYLKDSVKVEFVIPQAD